MLIRFKPNSTNQGWQGLSNGIITAATAAAGSTPAAPAGMDTWEVLDNTTAGGWTVQNVVADLTNVNQTGEYLRIVADTIKTPIDGFQKSIVLNRYEAGATNKFRGCALIASKVTTGSPFQQIVDRAMSMSTGPSATAVYNRWVDQYYLDQVRYTIAVTKQYLWIFTEHYIGSSGQSDNKIVGISDYTTGTEWDLTPGSLHFPVGGLYSGSTSSTSDIYDNHQIYAYGLHNQGELYGHEFNDLANWLSTYSIKNANNLTNSNTLGLGPYIQSADAVNTTYYFKNNWDANGDRRMALQDVAFWNPFNGMSYRELHGLKIVGWDRANNNYDTKRLQYKWMNADGVKYYLVEAGKGVYALSTV